MELPVCKVGEPVSFSLFLFFFFSVTFFSLTKVVFKGMEDAHTTINSYGDSGASFFAVFDGHGGEAVAKYSGKKLYKKIIDTPAFERGRYRDAIRSGYYGIDEDLLEGNVCVYIRKKREW